MLDRVIQALVDSNNDAADEVLLEALRLGNPREKSIVLKGRKAVGSLCWLIDDSRLL